MSLIIVTMLFQITNYVALIIERKRERKRRRKERRNTMIKRMKNYVFIIGDLLASVRKMDLKLTTTFSFFHQRSLCKIQKMFCNHSNDLKTCRCHLSNALSSPL